MKLIRNIEDAKRLLKFVTYLPNLVPDAESLKEILDKNPKTSKQLSVQVVRDNKLLNL